MKSLSNTTVTLDIAKLTGCTLNGSGGFRQALAPAARVHLQDEFQGRITGKKNTRMLTSLFMTAWFSAIAYTLAAEKAPYEIAQLEAQTALTKGKRKQVEEETRYRLPAEIQQIQAQTALTIQQKTNLEAEGLNISKQGELINAQVIATLREGDPKQQILLAEKRTFFFVIKNFRRATARSCC